MPELEDWELPLRQGLRALPTPAVSADFDERVLTALARPRPWWQTLWHQARPLLSGACCSLAVTLALASWAMQAPSPPVSHAPMSAATLLDMTAVNRLLDRPRLSAAALAGWDAAPPPSPADRPRPPTRPTEHAIRPPGRTSLTA